LTVENKGTYADKLMLYVPPVKKDMVKKGKEILKREGKTLSQWFLEQLEQYVNLHSPGNPQQRLDVIVKSGKPYTAPKTCKFCNKPPITWAIHVSGREYPVCQKHAEQLKTHPKWKVNNC